MGIVDFFKKKIEDRRQERKRKEMARNKEFNRDLTSAVALEMYNMKITKQPVLRFFQNDKGILEDFIISHLKDPNVEAIKIQNSNLYLPVLAFHALGAGVYVSLCQDKYKKRVEDFTVKEATEIHQAFRMTDPYELALKTLGIDKDSKNKSCLDHICGMAVTTAKEKLGWKVYDEANLRTLMTVMYNAGITLVVR